MSSVLQRCLDEKWGYGYVFELGLSLRTQGVDENLDEDRVAQMLLSEFSHFKEVMTMVWNEETIRKPAEDTVQDIRGYFQNASQPDCREEVDIERDELLDHFRCFDAAYKTLLVEFLPDGADINDLVRKTTKLAEQLKPLSCAKGWDAKVKKSIPNLLAGIFALFTVLKSGVAYNRLESSAGTPTVLGDELLMRPHNIQVLTLLCMFGCGQPSHETLESQLMQIRTGEGKSMILGAAATFLGLLGFRVRCVCYSEYLSDRDYGLFEDVFRRFQIHEDVVYSKITTLSEDTTAAKGDIRYLTESLVLGSLPNSSQKRDGESSTQIAVAGASVYERETPQDSSRLQCINSIEESAKTTYRISATGIGLPDKLQRQRSGEQLETTATTSSANPTVMASSERNIKPQQIKVQLETVSSHSPAEPTVMATSERVVQHQTGEQLFETTAGQSLAKEIVRKSDVGDVQLQEREHRLKADPIQPRAKPIVAPTFERKVKEEILLVDEVDVFFGQEFYGQTYNQVAQLREPEVSELLQIIWKHDGSQKKLRLADIKSTDPYLRLLQKMDGFEFLLENEISLMLKHVTRIDDEPYFLDEIEQRIGYKVMDTISYNVTYGYRTVFAYLQEYDRGNINDQTLSRVLTMPISCGQFSYADITPTRILGVSGTLDVMSRYEKEVLTRYGVNTYLYVPSVYGQSNFSFDQAGEGIAVETNKSNFYHKICEEIKKVSDEKRAVIVFFKDLESVKDFASSPLYQKLGRQKKILSEDMVPSEKDFVISKAATAKQITICPAVFGRGTDFFCKDAKVEKCGGVHVIQTFLSEQRSEEVQIQGRTSRQGKKGSYKLILHECDLVKTFGMKDGEKDTVPKSDWYQWLCDARDRYCDEHSKKVERNLAAATKKDRNTHDYFDALLAAKQSRAESLFKEIYLAMKRPLPSTVILDMAFAIDTTGSMHRFSQELPSILVKLLQGQDSIAAKLKVKFPELTFKLRVGVLGFRDIDDTAEHFEEKVWSDGSHFTEDMASVSVLVQSLASASSGGHDLAEDTVGAIHRCTAWNQNGDWAGTIKCLVVLTDAPAHGLAPTEFVNIQNGDTYSVRHPNGLTVESVVSDMMAKDIDLFFCSFDPAATSKTEQRLTDAYFKDAGNSHEKQVACIPMVQSNQSMGSLALTLSTKHIIFILDESGSMEDDWPGVVEAYNKYVARRLQSQSTLDLVSIVQFDDNARLTVDCEPITSVPNTLDYNGGGTRFSPAASLGSQAVQQSPASHAPVVVFMSDGGTDPSDSAQASQTLSQLNSIVLQRYNRDLELHVIAFGGGADTRQLLDISQASNVGRLHASADSTALTQVFESIAGGEDVTALMESQIGKRISDAVANKLSLEYIG
ncbi:unnamed protein product [Cylindrotheca closterium]|uniref:Uncharacterized protein n=1 Tax=Cylindrotheca closterium TaxID=2856 RepID=A0AAD2JNY5_9STRA|nr:unnamed protein product [Cylindrotheca closterium]